MEQTVDTSAILSPSQVNRNLDEVTVFLDKTTGDIIEVRATTYIDLYANGLSVELIKKYSALWGDLGGGAQGRVQDFINDVNNFIQNKEPIF